MHDKLLTISATDVAHVCLCWWNSSIVSFFFFMFFPLWGEIWSHGTHHHVSDLYARHSSHIIFFLLVNQNYSSGSPWMNQEWNSNDPCCMSHCTLVEINYLRAVSSQLKFSANGGCCFIQGFEYHSQELVKNLGNFRYILIPNIIINFMT